MKIVTIDEEHQILIYDDSSTILEHRTCAIQPFFNIIGKPSCVRCKKLVPKEVMLTYMLYCSDNGLTSHYEGYKVGEQN